MGGFLRLACPAPGRVWVLVHVRGDTAGTYFIGAVPDARSALALWLYSLQTSRASRN